MSANGSGLSHAAKAAAALDSVSEACLSAAQFYDLPQEKRSSVETHPSSLDDGETGTLESRIAQLELSLADVIAENSTLFATSREIAGEMRTIAVRTEKLERDLNVVQKDVRIEQQAKKINELEARMNQMEIRMNNKFATVEIEIEERMVDVRNGVNELATQIEKDVNGIETKCVEMKKTLTESIDTVEKTCMATTETMLSDVVENVVKKGFEQALETTEESLETLANEVLVYIETTTKKGRQESDSYRNRAQQRLESSLKDLRDSMREAFISERRRSDGISYKLSRLSIDGQATFEAQMLRTVETIRTLKEAVEERLDDLTRDIRIGREERLESNKSLARVVTNTERMQHRLESTRTRVENLDQEMEQKLHNIRTICEQATRKVSIRTGTETMRVALESMRVVSPLSTPIRITASPEKY
jgi:hypothetical protein